MKTTADLYKRAQNVMNNADPRTADLLEDVWVALQQREDGAEVLNKIIDYWQGRAEKAEAQVKAVYRAIPVDESMTETEQLLAEKVTYALAHPHETNIPVTDIDTILAVSSDKYSGISSRFETLAQQINPQELVNELVSSGWTILPEPKMKAMTIVVSPRGMRTNIPMDKEYVDYPRRLSEALNDIAKDRQVES